jgi:hypothetical protein
VGVEKHRCIRAWGSNKVYYGTARNRFSHVCKDRRVFNLLLPHLSTTLTVLGAGGSSCAL